MPDNIRYIAGYELNEKTETIGSKTFREAPLACHEMSFDCLKMKLIKALDRFKGSEPYTMISRS